MNDTTAVIGNHTNNAELNEQNDNRLDQSHQTDVCHSESFRLKGSSFHKNFQGTIKKCHKCIANNEQILFRIDSEQVNLRDENALVFQALVEGKWQSLGYVPGIKVSKITKAIQSNSIESLSIDRIFRQLVYGTDQFCYFAVIVVVRRGRWGPDEKKYRYNQL